MAYSATGALARQAWDDKITFEQRARDFWLKKHWDAPAYKSNGEPNMDAGAPIITLGDLTVQKKGAKMTLPWGVALTGDGTYGSESLSNPEEAITFGYKDVQITQLRMSSGQAGIISAIRNPIIRTRYTKKLLLNWMIWKQEVAKFNGLYRGFPKHVIDDSIGTASAHPNTFYHAGLEAITSLLEAHAMSTAVLDFVSEQVEELDIPYARFDDFEGIIGILHPKQVTSLLQDSNFRDTVTASLQRVKVGTKDTHPYFAGGDFIGQYRDIFLYKSKRVYSASDASVTNGTASQKGAIFMGARAIASAWGGYPNDFAAGPGVEGQTLNNIRVRFAPSDARDFLENDYWAVAALCTDDRADFTIEADSTVKNQSSLIVWTEEGT